MANISNLLIEKVKEATMFNSDGSVRWTASDISTPKINVTTESKEKVDGLSNVISKLYYGKKAEVSFDTAFFNLPLLAAQAGTEVVDATSTSKMVVNFREEITVGADSDRAVNTTITLDKTPYGETGSAVTHIYIKNTDNTLGKRYSSGVSADETHFSQSGKTITLPVGANIKATDIIVVYYDAEVEDGAKVVNTTDCSKASDSGIFRMYVQFKDICNEEVKYSGVVEFPSAQLSPDCEIGLDYDSTYSISLSANKKYCSAIDELFTIFVPAE